MTQSQLAPQEARLQRLLQYLAEDTQNQPLRLEIFDLALELGQSDLAHSCLGAGLDADPLDARWIYRRALMAIRSGDAAVAETLLAELLAEQGASVPVMYHLAFVQFVQGKTRQAIPTLQFLCANAAVEEPHALPLLMRCLQREGLVQEALQVFQLHAFDEAVSAEALGLASLMAIDIEDAANARLWSEQALQLQPRQREGLIARGTLALAREDMAGARSSLEECLALYPDSGRAMSALGLVHMYAQDFPTALACLERALVRMPSHIGSWQAAGWCRLALNDVVGARRDFEAALELDRNFSESHGAMAVALILAQDRNGAQEHINRALRLDAACVSGLYAQALLRDGKLEPRTLRRMARVLLGGRTTLGGEGMAEAVLRRMG